MNNLPPIRREPIEHNEEIAQEQRAELFQQVGRFAVALSEIEEHLAEIFIFLNATVAEEDSARVFYDVKNLTDKLGLVDFAVSRECGQNVRNKWMALSRRLARQKLIRNAAAHSSVRFTQKESSGRIVSLVSQPRDKWSKRPTLQIRDLRKACDNLQRLFQSLRTLTGVVVRDLG